MNEFFFGKSVEGIGPSFPQEIVFADTCFQEGQAKDICKMNALSS